MPQLLLEIFSEEIPARMQAGAARDLERMARERLAAAGFLPEALKTFAGPRRLTLVVEGLPAAQGDRREEVKGPRLGAPPQALEGFLRKTGLTQDQLVERDGVYVAVVETKGRATPDIVAEVVDQIVRGFAWPKSMTWGGGKLRWVRPIQRILCVFDREIVPFEIDGIQSGDLSEGHRFMGSGAPFKARDFDAYRAGLLAHFVVLDVEERKAHILHMAQTLCFARGLELVDDEALLDEVAGLAEWPTPVLGDMDPAFLDLPAEVIRTSMRTHQKYFAVRDPATGGLAPHFITIANIAAADGGAVIAAGNAKVLSARLSDARFFWDEDNLPGNFDAWLEKLNGVTFHAKLGTMAQRVERITALAREIAPLVGADPDAAALAARYAKADLASQMVGEFPELQGVMGRYYALSAAEDPPQSLRDSSPKGGASSPTKSSPPGGGGPEGRRGVFTPTIADALRDHYRPQGPGDAVPTEAISVAVALADKLDTLVGFFAIDEKPTGSKDPYALRRAALGVIRIVLENGVRFKLGSLAEAQWLRVFSSAIDAIRRSGGDPSGHLGFGLEHLLKTGGDWASMAGAEKSEFANLPLMRSDELKLDLVTFFADRLKVTLKDQGKRHDLVDAVFALGDDDLVRIVARVEALDGFLKTEDGANLLAGYKRAANILKAEEKKGPLPDGAPTAGTAPAETALFAALEAVAAPLDQALAAEAFTAAMTALAALRSPVDAFFEQILVNSEVAAERDNRLRLLRAVRAAMGRVADFSLVTG